MNKELKITFEDIEDARKDKEFQKIISNINNETITSSRFDTGSLGDPIKEIIKDFDTPHRGNIRYNIFVYSDYLFIKMHSFDFDEEMWYSRGAMYLPYDLMNVIGNMANNMRVKKQIKEVKK